MTERTRVTPDDPAFNALFQVAQILGPFSRLQQLRIMTAVAAQIGRYDFAQSFLQAARDEQRLVDLETKPKESV